MAFEKSLSLLRLAEMAAARHQGVCLLDVMEEFAVNQRTAQRMMRGLEAAFASVVHSIDDDRRKWWKLQDATVLRWQGVRDSELAALDMSIRRARREGADLDAAALVCLRDRILATMPGPHARRAEADAAAILEAQGYACRPGPKAQIAPMILGNIALGIKAPFALDLVYQGARDTDATPRKVEPYGLLLGVRQYLVARDTQQGGAYRRFRLDRITDARITGQSFARDPEFDLTSFAAQAFGSFHSDSEHGPVIWRFTPKAAPVARDFEFHPTQRLIDEPDGSLRVEFTASGWIEMIWHLYQWGDQVAVVAPEALKHLVKGFQRQDLEVLP
jgi:predicted DNA-binding transcriptional regulator YafY